VLRFTMEHLDARSQRRVCSSPQERTQLQTDSQREARAARAALGGVPACGKTRRLALLTASSEDSPSSAHSRSRQVGYSDRAPACRTIAPPCVSAGFLIWRLLDYSGTVGALLIERKRRRTERQAEAYLLKANARGPRGNTAPSLLSGRRGDGESDKSGVNRKSRRVAQKCRARTSRPSSLGRGAEVRGQGLSAQDEMIAQNGFERTRTRGRLPRCVRDGRRGRWRR
jgi:hypothetical protein